jgi:release factor glutamine methyltransferase
MYEPREDSLMLARDVSKYAKGLVLDMGTGNGIQAATAARKKSVNRVIALDIDAASIECCKKHIRSKKISFFVSDLFSIFKRQKKRVRFDTIIFNPPYLPQSSRRMDIALDGGKKGHEVLERFLAEVSDYLKPDGKILIVFSSLTNKQKVNELITNNALEFRELSKERIFFEELYVYLVKKSPLLVELERKGVKNVRYFSKGKRGIVFVGYCRKRKVAIKAKNPESRAVARIENEVRFLRILNKKNIGPRLLFSSNEYFVCDFVDGSFMLDFLQGLCGTTGGKKRTAARIIRSILRQLFIMDTLGINKEEMSHPRKHIIIEEKSHMPVLIDFERCHATKRPSNVTQFCSFLASPSVAGVLKKNGICINREKIINLARQYRKNLNKKSFNAIVEAIR